MKRLILVALGVACCTAPAFAFNVLSNAGFETGSMAPWFQSQDFGGPENWNVTNAVAHSGSFSATDVGNKEIRQNFAAISGSSITNIDLWVRNMDSGALINFVTLYYSDNTSDGTLIFESSTDWENHNFTSLLNTSKNLVGIGVFGFQGGSGAEDRSYVDDFRIDAVPEPATMSVLALGAAFLARRRRKQS